MILSNFKSRLDLENEEVERELAAETQGLATLEKQDRMFAQSLLVADEREARERLRAEELAEQ